MRISANVISIVGGMGASISALYFFPKGEFLIGVIAVTIFALFDLFDGTVARLSAKGSSKWGGFLDSTIDRITDSAITIAVLIPLIRENDKLAYLALITLVTGLLIPYIRAKAESFSIDCSVGVTVSLEG